MSKLHVRKDDTVIVISGTEKGKKGKVVAVSPDERKVIIEGVNIKKKHSKPRKQGEAGGIMDVEGAMYADKVQLFSYKSRPQKGRHPRLQEMRQRILMRR